MIFTKKCKLCRDHRAWYAYICYICFISFTNYISGEAINVQNGTIRLVKHVLFIVILLYYSGYHMITDIKLVDKYEKITMICTIYIYIQVFFFYLFHIAIPGYYKFFLYQEQYAARLAFIESSSFFRPTSIFYEPSHYACYVYPMHSFYLFDERKYSIKRAFLLTCGIFMSTSTLGIFLTLIAWSIWFFLKIKSENKRKIFTFFIFILLTILLIAFFSSDVGMLILSRTFAQGEVSGGNAALARLSSYEEFFQLPYISRIFGVGYGFILDTGVGDKYYSSWAFNLTCVGVIGTAMILFIFFRYYRNSDLATKILILLVAIECCGQLSFAGTRLLFTFSLIMKSCYSKIAKRQALVMLNSYTQQKP